jgi:GNAT superfamily N-acetyltransferase
MQIETNNLSHLPDFVRLNEIWITEHFSLEEADRALAANPAKVIDNGGFIFSLTQDGKVVGVCALFKENAERYELARMAVAPNLRGEGCGRALMDHALKHALSVGAKSVYLLSNTVLEPAIALYKRFGFTPISTGQHPVYARCNIVMERAL